MILVTGGLGFIGVHYARALLDAGEDVILTQHRLRSRPYFVEAELGKRVFVEQLDVTDNDALMAIGKHYKVTGICHLAGPGYNAATPALDFRVNVFGLLNLLEAAHSWEVKRLTLASSVAVYNGEMAGPFGEDQPLRILGVNPIETYKKADEVLAQHYAERTGIDIALMRIALIYGPLHIYNNLAAQLSRAAADGKSLDLTGEVWEDDSVDLCYIKDCVDAMVRLQIAERLSHRVYNVGAGVATTNRTLGDAVERVVPGWSVKMSPGKSPLGRTNPSMSLARINVDTGYAPHYSLDAGLAEYVAWLRNKEV